MRPRAFIGFQVKNFCPSNRTAFTRAELIATLAGLFLCLAVLVPSFANNGPRSEQVSCLNNLRQIGIAFQAWGNEHDDQRPWFVSANVPPNEGGTRGHPLMNNAFIHFSPLSNYTSPAVLIDPGEVTRSKRLAQNWSVSPEGGFLNGAFRDNALSYMLGLHTLPSEPAGILSGDRNVLFNGVSGCGYGFTQVLRLDVFSSALFRGWTNGNHGMFGNVLLNDGRVVFTSSARLYALMRAVQPDAGNEHFLAPAQ